MVNNLQNDERQNNKFTDICCAKTTHTLHAWDCVNLDSMAIIEYHAPHIWARGEKDG
jgi:hypothetical protein